MFTYNFGEWLMFFYIYCFVGWIIESAVVSVRTKRIVNRGFMRGPFLPLYGFGAIAILFSCLPVQSSPTLVFVCGMLAASILEYFTGWLMETLFKTKYWDYSYMKFNIKGRVSLITSLFWGFLSLFLTDILHGITESMVTGTPIGMIIIFDTIISCIFLSDLTYAFKTAFDVNKLLEKIETIRAEQKTLEERLSGSEGAQWVRARIDELRLEYQGSVGKLNPFKRDYIKGNPTAFSKRFNEALVELREKIDRKSDK